MPPRTLGQQQSCQVWVYDLSDGQPHLVLETRDRLFEAPNWTLDGTELILNGDGLLWRFDLATRHLSPLDIQGLPPVNNDHVLDPDGAHIYASTYEDWQIYRAPLAGGVAVQITGQEGPPGLMHFLHGVSRGGDTLAFVGVRAEPQSDGLGDGLKFVSAEIFTIGADGTGLRQLTQAGVPADGPEFSPDGQWIYLNTEAFCGHAQIGRMRPDGTRLERLTRSDTVDWFPHPAPDQRRLVYLAYPPGTKGHPADKWVDLMLVEDDRWDKARPVVRLFGGQGTINVNSWAPDGQRFAYVAYPHHVGA